MLTMVMVMMDTIVTIVVMNGQPVCDWPLAPIFFLHEALTISHPHTSTTKDNKAPPYTPLLQLL